MTMFLACLAIALSLVSIVISIKTVLALRETKRILRRLGS